MPANALMTRALRREYRIGRGTVTALGGLDIEISAGEFVAIVGPSGCGKSTLLNLLGGLDQPTSGSVEVDGVDLAGHDEAWLAALRRKKIGFIFQRHDLFPVLTARENVEFPLLLSGVGEEARKENALELLALVGLEGIADRLPEELSGGQQQRVGIARALANSPEILLADEPTGNLDAATSGEIMAVLTGLRRKLGLTLVVVTHDGKVAGLADRMIRLRDGRLADHRGRDEAKGTNA